jgi:transcriptional regulator with XRE-family HTH domain
MPPLRPPTLVGLLKDYRAAAGLTQGELAERARLSVRAISDLERGVRRAPHKDTLLLLAEALGLDEEKRGLLLEAARRSRRIGLPATTALLHAPPLPSDYPNALTPLIGRERDEASVTHLLTQASVRLLTLTGPAGIGKTRLAMQVAANLRDRFADGVVFISLAAISDPHLVLRAVAQEFGLREQVSQAMEEQLRNFLAERETLIVLDNFEQVARAGPDVARFVAACPDVKALVTSRAALRIRGEHEFAVPPLDTPDLACLPVVEDLTQYAAVALFMQRARGQANLHAHPPRRPDRRCDLRSSRWSATGAQIGSGAHQAPLVRGDPGTARFESDVPHVRTSRLAGAATDHAACDCLEL